MEKILPEKITLARCEFATAILLTLTLIAFHAIFFLHAGALWRDEISSVALATKPTLSEFWRSLRFDPFPVSYFLLLRFWTAIGLGGSDLALRGLGLLISVSLIGALWLSCYLINRSPPLWPLALFAFNPMTLEGGDTLRPYGFGLIWAVLAFALIWRIAFGQSGKKIVFSAFLIALLSVQSLFTNAFTLLAIGAGAAVVLLPRKKWREFALVASVGVLAALSLLPYLPVIQATQDWAMIVGNKNDIGSVLNVGSDAIADGGRVAEWGWLALGCGLLVLSAVSFALRDRLAAIVDLNRERLMFAATTVAVAAGATITFLCAAQYLIFPRYFLPLMAVISLCVQIFWSALPNRAVIRTLSLCLVLLIGATSLRPLWERARLQMTNCDKIAAAVEQRAGADDLILVTSCLYGVSFQRYYHGQTPWVTLPPLADLRLHRWDLLKQALSQPDPVPDLVSRAATVLRAGHKVFLVGNLGPATPDQPEPFPPAPQSNFGWQMEPYLAQWKSELTYWIEHHALHGNNLPIEEGRFVNRFERFGLFELSGLREP